MNGSVAIERTQGREAILLYALRHKSVWAVVASAVALLIALLPVQYALVIIGGSVLVLGAIAEPLIALALMLIIGLAEPLLGAAGLLPFPVGQAGFALFAAAWLGRGLSQRSLRWPILPITIPFFLYLAACALSVFVTQPASPLDAFTELLKWGEMYLIAGIVVDAAGRKKLWWAVGVLLFVGALQAGIGIWQFQFRGHGPESFIILGNRYRAYGTLEQPNPFGGLMGIVWPVAAALTAQSWISWLKNRQWVAPRVLSIIVVISVVAAMSVGALVASFSRGAWLGAGVAGLAMLVFWPRKRWIGFGLAGVGVIAFAVLYSLNLLPAFIAARFADATDFVQVYDVRGIHINDSNFSIIERVAHWQAALRMADAQPLTGVGFGNYEAAYSEYRLINWKFGLGHAHNIYLNVLAETGAIGLAAYLVLWGSIIWLTIKVINHPAQLSERALAIGLLGCWVHLATHQVLDNLYVGNIALYIGALLGILCIIATHRNPLPITETA
jgi:putative inorganic carbon (hco3(-)) transporter